MDKTPVRTPFAVPLQFCRKDSVSITYNILLYLPALSPFTLISVCFSFYFRILNDLVRSQQSFFSPN